MNTRLVISANSLAALAKSNPTGNHQYTTGGGYAGPSVKNGEALTDKHRAHLNLTPTSASGLKPGDKIVDGAGRFHTVTRADQTPGKSGTLLAHTGNPKGVMEHPSNTFTKVTPKAQPLAKSGPVAPFGTGDPEWPGRMAHQLERGGLVHVRGALVPHPHPHWPEDPPSAEFQLGFSPEGGEPSDWQSCGSTDPMVQGLYKHMRAAFLAGGAQAPTLAKAQVKPYMRGGTLGGGYEHKAAVSTSAPIPATTYADVNPEESDHPDWHHQMAWPTADGGSMWVRGRITHPGSRATPGSHAEPWGHPGDPPEAEYEIANVSREGNEEGEEPKDWTPYHNPDDRVVGKLYDHMADEADDRASR